MKKPSESEEEFFAREDAAKRHKLALERERTMAQAEREALKQLHYMHCPKCGMKLETTQYRDVAIDRCFHCQGVWLDAGELEILAGKEPGFLEKVAGVFRK